MVERLDKYDGHELIGQYHLSEKTYSEALKQWGEPTLVELLTLVCWLMNVAHAPGPAT